MDINAIKPGDLLTAATCNPCWNYGFKLTEEVIFEVICGLDNKPVTSNNHTGLVLTWAPKKCKDSIENFKAPAYKHLQHGTAWVKVSDTKLVDGSW